MEKHVHTVPVLSFPPKQGSSQLSIVVALQFLMDASMVYRTPTHAALVRRSLDIAGVCVCVCVCTCVSNTHTRCPGATESGHSWYVCACVYVRVYRTPTLAFLAIVSGQSW